MQSETTAPCLNEGQAWFIRQPEFEKCPSLTPTRQFR